MIEAATGVIDQIHAAHSERVTELRAEVKRLRTNINELQTYANGQAAARYRKASEENPLMALYYRGMALTYEDMERRSIVAYAKEAE